jgi:hypothetical protein
MEKTKKPTVAGIFNIITGALGIIGAIGMFIGFSVVGGGWGIPGMEAIPAFVPGIILWTAIPSLLIAVLALVGGIFAVQRKRWGWALAGSIAAIFSLIFLGIPAVILVAISKNEFE